MDSNSQPRQSQDTKINYNKKFLIVKLPANVVNHKKAVELLGGKDKITSKYMKNEDLELDLFDKLVPLEKCFTHDVVIRRKRLRNKKNPNEKKYVYQVMGKVDAVYDYFAMHDFVCLKDNKEEIDLKNLEKFVIKPEEVEEFNENNTEEKITELKKVKRIIGKQIEENIMPAVSKDFTFFQPNKFSYGRNSYPHFFKELKNKIDIDKIN